MEHEATKSHEKISKIRHFKNGVVPMFSATLDTFVCEVDEHEIGQGVDEFGGIVGGIVVLPASIKAHLSLWIRIPVPLNTIAKSR